MKLLFTVLLELWFLTLRKVLVCLRIWRCILSIAMLSGKQMTSTILSGLEKLSTNRATMNPFKLICFFLLQLPSTTSSSLFSVCALYSDMWRDQFALCKPKELELSWSTVLKSAWFFWSCDGNCPNKYRLKCVPNVAWVAHQTYAIPDRDRWCWRDSQENMGECKLAAVLSYAGSTPQDLWPDCSARSCPRSGSRSGKEMMKMISLLST